MNRNDVIDSFRAIAIFLVTGFHISGWALSGSGVVFSDISTFINYGQFDAIGIIGNGWVGVGMFFVISGYCMANSVARRFSHGMSAKAFANYALNRLMRIGLPYYVAILVWVILIDRFGVTSKSTGVKDILMHLFFVHNTSIETMHSISGVFWSLAVEMQFCMILPLIFIFFKSSAMRCTALLLSFVFTVMINKFSKNILLTWSIASYLYLFLLGWFLALLPNYFKIKFASLWVLLPGFIAFSLLICYRGNNYDMNLKLYEILTATVFSIFMMSCVMRFRNHKNNFIVSILSFIGRCSFSIYLYNYIFWCLKPGVNSVTSVLGAFLFVIIIGIAMHFIIERNSEKLRRYVFSSGTDILKLIRR